MTLMDRLFPDLKAHRDRRRTLDALYSRTPIKLLPPAMQAAKLSRFITVAGMALAAFGYPFAANRTPWAEDPWGNAAVSVVFTLGLMSWIRAGQNATELEETRAVAVDALLEVKRLKERVKYLSEDFQEVLEGLEDDDS